MPLVARLTRQLKSLIVPCTLLLVLVLGSGCKNGFLNPAEVGRFKKDVLAVRILDQLQPGTDDLEPEFYGASEIRAEDLEFQPEDYVIQSGDVVSVTVEDLMAAGQGTVMSRVVTDMGTIRLQLLDEPVQAAGLTEGQLEDAVEEAYRQANLLPQAGVTVGIEQYQGRTFSMVGAWNQPNRYQIYKPNLRMLDAFQMAHGVPQGVETVYILRRETQSSQVDAEVAPRDPLAPEPMDEMAPPPGQTTTAPDERFAFNPPSEPNDMRIIRVPIDDLLRGELKYDVVIRPNDMLLAPVPRVGIYYMGGHVVAPGPYQILPGNRVTLKQAVIAARMLDGLAIPERTDVIRKVNDNQEVWVSVNLEKIFSGEVSDFYLRPDDQVLVGTNAIAPFLAAARNAFRLTYGAGFVYDRNFAYDRDDNNN